MANELQTVAPASSTVNALLFDVNGNLWTGSSYVAISTVAASGYAAGAVALSEQSTSDSVGSVNYKGSIPSGALSACNRSLYFIGTPIPASMPFAIQQIGPIPADMESIKGTALGSESAAGNMAGAFTNSFNRPSGLLPIIDNPLAASQLIFSFTGNGKIGTTSAAGDYIIPSDYTDPTGYFQGFEVFQNTVVPTFYLWYSRFFSQWYISDNIGSTTNSFTNDESALTGGFVPVAGGTATGTLTLAALSTIIPPATPGTVGTVTDTTHMVIAGAVVGQYVTITPAATGTPVTSLITAVAAGNVCTLATAITCVAGDAFTLENVSTIQQVVGLPNPVGPGGKTVVITVETTGNTPISGAAVWITTDAAGSNTIAGTLYSNAEGQVTFLLPLGLVYVWRMCSGYTFTNPQALTVT